MKILINATVLRQLLDAHPEVEIDLVSSAAAQVASQFRRKVDVRAIADQMIMDINAKLAARHLMPPFVISAITEVAKQVYAEYAQRIALEIATQKVEVAISAAVAKYDRQLIDRMEAKIDKIINEKVSAVFAAAAKLGGK